MDRGAWQATVYGVAKSWDMTERLSTALEAWASLVAQLVKYLSAMPETLIRSLGWKVPLEEGMAAHSSILA